VTNVRFRSLLFSRTRLASLCRPMINKSTVRSRLRTRYKVRSHSARTRARYDGQPRFGSIVQLRRAAHARARAALIRGTQRPPPRRPPLFRDRDCYHRQSRYMKLGNSRYGYSSVVVITTPLGHIVIPQSDAPAIVPLSPPRPLPPPRRIFLRRCAVSSISKESRTNVRKIAPRRRRRLFRDHVSGPRPLSNPLCLLLSLAAILASSPTRRESAIRLRNPIFVVSVTQSGSPGQDTLWVRNV